MSIVVGYRPTPEGAAALEHALEEQHHRQTRILILHSSEPLDRSLKQSLEQQIDALSNRLATAGVDHDIRGIDVDADPADAILNAAAEADAQLMVIGVRRRSPVGKLFLGSTAQRVLLEADCPVLAVKPNDIAPGRHS